MTCQNCKKTGFHVLYMGWCKKCHDLRPAEVLVLPKHKPRGIATRKRLKTHRRGLYIVRVRDGVYLNTGRKKPLVGRTDAYVYRSSDWADRAAVRVRGKVEVLCDATATTAPVISCIRVLRSLGSKNQTESDLGHGKS